MVRVSIFLIAVILVAGMVPVMSGCVPTQYTLSISSTAGGTVTVPGEGSFTYEKGTVVELVVEAEEGYGLTWTGDVYYIASIHSLSTNITMYDNYSITATFAKIQGIQDWYDLDVIRDDPSGHYALMNNLDCTTPGYEELASQTANGGKGWEPIGFLGSTGWFTGTFDGQGHEIRNLCVNRTETDEDTASLFGSVDRGGIIKNIGMVNATVAGFLRVCSLVGQNGGIVSNCFATGNIIGRGWVGGLVGSSSGTITECYSGSIVTGTVVVGGLVGSMSDGTISGCYATGSVTGHSMVGGLVGWNSGSTVSNCHATGNTSGDEQIGGLIGYSYLSTSTVSNSHSTGNVNGDKNIGGLVGRCGGTVSTCYATGSVSGNSSVGGLAGRNGGTVSTCYATGSVSGNFWVGGVAGWNGGTVSKCYTTGDVTGDQRVGGLLGENIWGTVSDSYSVGNVTGENYVGGLVGLNIAYEEGVGTITNSYSTGKVTGESAIGGLVGQNSGTVIHSFWDTQTSEQPTSDGGTGKNTTEMQDIATFSEVGWSIGAVALNDTNPAYIWNIVDDETYPFLSW